MNQNNERRTYYAFVVIVMVLGALALLGLTITINVAQAGSAEAAENPYVVDATGIHLTNGETFLAGGHVNINPPSPGHNLSFEEKCISRTDYECDDAKNGSHLHADAQYIGKEFIPWSAFGVCPATVTWVQIAGHDKHYGDAGEPAIVPDCNTVVTTPTETPSPTATPSPEATKESTPSPTASTSAPTTTPGPTSTPAIVQPHPTVTRLGKPVVVHRETVPSAKATTVATTHHPAELARTGSSRITYNAKIVGTIIVAVCVVTALALIRGYRKKRSL